MRTLFALLSLLFAFNLLAQEDLQVIIQTGHAGKINAIVFNKMQTKVFSGGKDSKLILWDVRTGKQEREVVAHEGAINKLEFLNDSVIVSCSDDKTIKFWNTQTLEHIKTIGPFEYAVKSMGINQKNGNIAVGTRFMHIVNSEGKITTLKALSFDHFDAVHYLDSKGHIIYGGRKDKFTRVIDENTLDIIKNITINATSIDSYKDEYVIGDIFGGFYYFNQSENKEKRYSLESPLIAVNSVSIFGNRIIIARSDGIVEEIIKENFTTFNYFKGHLSEVSSVDFGGEMKYFISADIEGNIIYWNNLSKRISKLFRGEANPINVCKFSDSEDELLIGYSNGILRSINLISNNVISNRLYFGEEKKLKGWKYSIISLDEQVGDILKFQALKTKTFDENTRNLSYCEIWQGEWDLKKNKIRLTEEIRKEESKKLIQDQSVGKQIVWQTYFLDKSALEVKAKFTSRYLRINSNHIEVFDKNKGEVKSRQTANHNDLITGVDYNKKFDVAISYSWDGSIKFWSPTDLNEVADLFLFGQRNFLWINPQKYYFSSKGALENVAFSWKGEVFPFDQFDVKYNRPDLIYEKLPFLDRSLVLEMHKAYQKRLKKLGIKVEDIKISSDLPKINVEIPEQAVVDADLIPIQFRAYHSKENIIETRVLVNGVPLNDPNLIFNQPKKEISSIASIPLSPGENIIEFYAISASGLKSLKESFTIESKLKKGKPDLYLVTVGISEYKQTDFNLNYAAKDSKDMTEKMENSKIYRNVYTKNLADGNATFDNINSIKDFVKDARYHDVVIIFAAGHGVLDANLDYYFAAHDMDFYDPSKKGVPFGNFEDILESTKSRKKLLLLDACHSGEVDKDEVKVEENVVEEGEDISFRAAGTDISNKSGNQISSFQLSRMLFADTRESNGSTVISSASGTEYAIEGKNWNNGVFTYSFIYGLTTKDADLNRDGQIMLSEMQTYLNIKVLELTDGKQNPNSRVENLKSDFRLW